MWNRGLCYLTIKRDHTAIGNPFKHPNVSQNRAGPNRYYQIRCDHAPLWLFIGLIILLSRAYQSTVLSTFCGRDRVAVILLTDVANKASYMEINVFGFKFIMQFASMGTMSNDPALAQIMALHPTWSSLLMPTYGTWSQWIDTYIVAIVIAPLFVKWRSGLRLYCFCVYKNLYRRVVTYLVMFFSRHYGRSMNVQMP